MLSKNVNAASKIYLHILQLMVKEKTSAIENTACYVPRLENIIPEKSKKQTQTSSFVKDVMSISQLNHLVYIKGKKTTLIEFILIAKNVIQKELNQFKEK